MQLPDKETRMLRYKIWKRRRSSFHRLLWNHKKFQPACSCLQIRSQFSGLPTTGGHVFASAEQMAAQIPVDLGFPFTRVELQFFQINRNIFKRRSSSSFGGQNGMGYPYIGFRISVFFCVRSGSCIWHMLIELDAATLLLLTMKKAMFLKKHILEIFCNTLPGSPARSFHDVLSTSFESSARTWNAPDIFEQLDGSTEFHRQTTLQAIPAWVRKEYHWGICASASLPYGYVLF